MRLEAVIESRGERPNVHRRAAQPGRPDHARLRFAVAQWVARLVNVAIVPRLAILVGLTSLMWTRVNHAALLGWLIGAACTQLIGLYLADRFERRHPSDDAVPVGDSAPGHSPAAAALLVAVAVEGLVWIALLVVARAGGGGQTVQMIAVAAVIASIAINVVIQASVRRTFVASQLTVAVPTVALLLASPNTLLRATSAAFVCYVILTFVLHARINTLMLETFGMTIRNADLAEQLSETNQLLSVQADSDPLTGAMNRRGLIERLEQVRADSTAVAFFDLDRFKLINDTHGHFAGDELLRTVADRVGAELDAGETLGRYGGDEFVAILRAELLPGESSRARTSRLMRRAEHIRQCVATPASIGGHQVEIATSIGLAIGPSGGTDGMTLLRHADTALRAAKDSGRGRVELYNDAVRERIVNEMNDEDVVRRAIADGEIVPWYQPIVDARTGRVVAAEILARWLTPDGATITAEEFISIATDSGQIERLCEVVTERAIEDVREIEHYWPPNFRLGVNLPPRFLSQSGRVQRLMSLLRSAPDGLLSLEVTERSAVDDLDFAAARLSSLRDRGISVVLDDFGTGMASLTMLQRLPFDGVKIDRSFVASVDEDHRDRALVRGLLAMSSDLDLRVVAEGVEQSGQSRQLTEMGCFHQQGYLFGTATDVFGLRDRLIRMPADPRRTEPIAIPAVRRRSMERGSEQTGAPPVVRYGRADAEAADTDRR